MPNRTLLELNTQTSPFSLHSCGQKGLGRLIEEEIALEPEEISSKKVWSIFKPQRQLSAPTIALGEVASDSLAIRQGATLLKVTLQRYSIGIDKANITFHVALDPEAISGYSMFSTNYNHGRTGTGTPVFKSLSCGVQLTF